MNAFLLVAAFTLTLCLPSLVAEEKSDELEISMQYLTGLTGTEKWRTAVALKAGKEKRVWAELIDGEGIILNGADGKAGNAYTERSFGDVEVEVEFTMARQSNSGLYFMDRYEIQLFDSFGRLQRELNYSDCGGIYQRWDETRDPQGWEGTAPLSNPTLAPGEWQKLKIRFRAPRFDADGKKIANARFKKVELNGVVVIDDVELTGPTRGGKGGKEVAEAPLRLQGTHGPVAFRKIVIRPL